MPPICRSYQKFDHGHKIMVILPYLNLYFTHSSNQESNNNTISFTVSQTDDNNLTQEGIIALLSTSPLLTIVNDKDAEVSLSLSSWWFKQYLSCRNSYKHFGFYKGF